MAIPLGGKPPSGWSSETYHEDRRAFEHRASATELGKQSLLSELPACGTPQFARAGNKSALPLQLAGKTSAGQAYSSGHIPFASSQSGLSLICKHPVQCAARNCTLQKICNDSPTSNQFSR